MNNLPKLAAATLVAGLASLDAPISRQAVAEDVMSSEAQSKQADHPYVGMWVTEDGRIRQELLPNGRYDEARGNRKSAYQGRYEVTGNQIDYWDDTGFTADGEFMDDVLHHGGMVFYRER
ncbi:hypothetical protein BTE77_31100 [Ensifer adhaerens]|nr:hypothetical protein BTE77_31100 [Ensifer adhaerens]